MADEVVEHEPESVTIEETHEEEAAPHVPAYEERLEHCYAELAAIRTEIAELRGHTHAEFAHASHEHDQYAPAAHTHETETGSTSEPEHESSGGDAHPEPIHPWFRKVGR